MSSFLCSVDPELSAARRETGWRTCLGVVLAVLLFALPGATPSATLEASSPVTVHVRIEGPVNPTAFPETGEYALVWAGDITVPEDFTVTCTSGESYHLYVNNADRYIAERLSDHQTWDRGPADSAIGATSVLAALDAASDLGGFTYEVSDTWFPGMGFFVQGIAGYGGMGAAGWNYRVWNDSIAGLAPVSSDMFLLGYDGMPVTLPHTQVLFYWGGGGACYPLRVLPDTQVVGKGEHFGAEVEYFKDSGWAAGGWLPLDGAEVWLGNESFTAGETGVADVFLECDGSHVVTARREYCGGSYFVPSDELSGVDVAGGDSRDWWIETDEASFASGEHYQVDASAQPGCVLLHRGGQVSVDYVLDGGSETLGGEYFFDEFRLLNGATVYLAGEEPLVVHATTIEIDATSRIDGDGAGYVAGDGGVDSGEDGRGWGAGCGAVHGDGHGGGGGGAGYYWQGGRGSSVSDSLGAWEHAAAGGGSYGGTCIQGAHTFYLGSGGGAGAGDGVSAVGGDGGAGGGAVRLDASSVTIDGAVTARGVDGGSATAAGCGGGGGGSGGTIYIAGSDVCVVDGAFAIGGGDGGDGVGPNGHGGGGGSGGHIKVFYESVNDSIDHSGAYSDGGVGDPYSGGRGYMGSGKKDRYWLQETFVPQLPFFGDGAYASASHDCGGNADWGKLYWCATTSAGAEVRFQIATNGDNATWVFRGPDGTVDSYYCGSGIDVWSGHNGDRYVKYRAFLSTAEPGQTPVLSKVGLTYSEAGAPEIISFTVTDFNDDGVVFGSLDPGTLNGPADRGVAVGAITLTVGIETNVDVDVQLKGTDFVGPDILSVGEVKYDDDDDVTGAGVLTSQYVTWYSVAALPPIEDVTQVYCWLGVPAGQPAGNYESTFYYRAVKTS